METGLLLKRSFPGSFSDISVFHTPLESLSKISEIKEEKFQKSKIHEKQVGKRTFRRSPSFHQKMTSQADSHNYFSQLATFGFSLKVG